MPTKENRRAARRKHDSVLEIYDESGKHITGIGRLIDFSNVGVRFATTKILHKGDLVRGRLRLLKEGILLITAHIVWTKAVANTHHYGLEFDTVKKTHKK